jgi:hypothetical protein
MSECHPITHLAVVRARGTRLVDEVVRGAVNAEVVVALGRRPGVGALDAVLGTGVAFPVRRPHCKPARASRAATVAFGRA